MGVVTKSVPRCVGAAAERAIAVRGQPDRLKRVFERSSVPMLLIDRDRRFVDANRPARLTFRSSLAELQKSTVDDLTATEWWPTMEAAWARLIGSGCMAGPHAIALRDGGRFDVTYYALADVLPGLHLVAFAPSDFPEGELLDDLEQLPPESSSSLTTRELELLELAAEGLNGPGIAHELGLSAATVRTHFENIYAKLGVRDRAAAVAKSMRLGLIA